MLLIRILVLNPEGQPVIGAWVDVEGMWKSQFYEEQTTDSRGVFYVAVEPGEHRVMVTKEGYQQWERVEMMKTDADEIIAVLVR